MAEDQKTATPDGHAKMLADLRKYQSAHQDQLKARRHERSAHPEYPEQAKSFWEWWESTGKNQYGTVAEFARAVGVYSHQIWSYMRGEFRPEGDRRAKLFELTRLDCFAPDEQVGWTKDFINRCCNYIDSLPAEFATKKRHREYVRHIVARLRSAGIAGPAEITVGLLLKYPPSYGPDQTKRIALGVFTHLLAELGVWDHDQEKKFKEMLRPVYPHKVRRKTKPNGVIQPSKMGAFIAALVVNGGIGVQQVQNLRIGQIESGGIRLGKNQLLRFGEGWHRIQKSVVDAYLQEARPQDYLFYSYRPRDYHRPISRKPITDALKGLHSGRAGSPIETAHFEEDARRIENPRRLRAHLRHFHELSGRRTWLLMKKLYPEGAETFGLPEPYLLGVACASGLLRDAASRQRGHTFAYTWHGLCGGRYDISVTWPVKLFLKMRDGRNKPGLARLLLKLAQERWEDGRHGLTDKRSIQTSKRLIDHWQRVKHPMSGKVRSKVLLTEGVDSDVLHLLEVTHVEVRSNSGATWAGQLLDRTKKQILMPILDRLEGGPTNPRCPICGDPHRDAIDAELRDVLSGNGTYADVARKYGIVYGANEGQLLWHAGRLLHNDLPGHLGSAAPAPVIRCAADLLTECARANAPALADVLLRLANADEQTIKLKDQPQVRAKSV